MFVKANVVLKTVMTIAIVLTITTSAQVFAQSTKDLMEMSLDDLLNMDVTTASKTSQKASEAPSIVSVITAREIKNMGARNIVDVLRTVPGFDLTAHDSRPNHEISIRGMKNLNKVKIMINGHSLAGTDGYIGAAFDGIPLASIKQIEIIRGPGSALYGAGAFIGVVNLILKDGNNSQSALAMEGGSYSSWYPTGQFAYAKGDFSAYVYGDFFQTDGFKKTITEDNQPFGPMGSSIPGPMNNDKDYVSTQMNLNYGNFSLHGYLNKLETNVPIGVTKALTNDNKYDRVYGYAELGWNKPMMEKGNLQLKAYYDYASRTDMFELFSEETASLMTNMGGGGFPEGVGVMAGPRNKNSVIGSEVTLDYQLSPIFQIVSGLSFENHRQYDVEHYANHNVTGAPLVVNGVTYPPFPFIYFPAGMTNISETGNWSINTDRTITAGYAQTSFDLKQLFNMKYGKAWSLVTGVRYDNYSDVGSTVNPRAGIVFSPSEKLYFKALYGKAFRAPSFLEMYARGNPSTLGNSNLKPEKVSTFEAQCGYDLSKNVRSSVTYFNTNTEDIIIMAPGPVAGGPEVYSNLGTVEASGVETELKVGLSANRYAYVNATYQNLKNSTNEVIYDSLGTSYSQRNYNPGGIPEIYGNLGINTDLGNNILANIWINYVGERTRSEEKVYSGLTLATADQRSSIKARTLLNASVTFHGFIPRTELQMSGYNLSDSDYRDPEWNGVLDNDIPREGRSFRARLSYAW